MKHQEMVMSPGEYQILTAGSQLLGFRIPDCCGNDAPMTCPPM
jgi:hypothetical protein